MKNWIYPETVNRVKDNINNFLIGDLSVKSLQFALYQAEQEINSHEEKWLRDLFFDVENKIEEILYTFSEFEQGKLIKDIAEMCLHEIYNYENQ